MFELSDASGDPAGQIEVTLRWRSSYLPPPSSISTPKEEEQSREELHSWEDEEKYETGEEEWGSRDPVGMTTPQPKEAQVVTRRLRAFRRLLKKTSEGSAVLTVAGSSA